jgi:hypothetical protein
VRQVAREPEELELEREREQVDRGRSRRRANRLVQEIEEANERVEGVRVLVVLDEETKHCLEPDRAGADAIRVGGQRVVGADQVSAGDGRELAPALVEKQVDMTEGLEAGAEAGAGAAGALRDRPDATPLLREELEDAVSLLYRAIAGRRLPS